MKSTRIWSPGFQFILWIVHIHFNKVLTCYICDWTKQGNVEDVNRFKNDWFIFYWILVLAGSKSCCCIKYPQLSSLTLNILIFLQDKETPEGEKVHRLNQCWTTNIWFKMIFRTCFFCISHITSSNSCCVKKPQLFIFDTQHSLNSARWCDFPFRKNVFGSTFWFEPTWPCMYGPT